MLYICCYQSIIWNGSKEYGWNFSRFYRINQNILIWSRNKCYYFQYKILSSGIVSWVLFCLLTIGNYGFIPIRILGSAFTLLSITLYSLAKLMFCKETAVVSIYKSNIIFHGLDICFVLLFYFGNFL
jgi:hypothetical protein